MRQNIFFTYFFTVFKKLDFFHNSCMNMIRNKYTKNQNQDWTYFYYVSYKWDCNWNEIQITAEIFCSLQQIMQLI